MIMEGDWWTLFTKEEQKSHVIVESNKSSKPPLDPERVQKIFAEILMNLTIIMSMCEGNSDMYKCAYIKIFLFVDCMQRRFKDQYTAKSVG